jgi:hypothetical protein
MIDFVVIYIDIYTHTSVSATRGGGFPDTRMSLVRRE